MKYIITYETSFRYDRDYMIAAICSTSQSADRKVAALKKKLTKQYNGSEISKLSRVISSVRVTPWDGKTPMIAFQFIY